MANTGNKVYTILKEKIVGTSTYTGITKPNDVSDPDYVAPVEDLTMCPLTTTTTTTTTSTTTTTTTTLTTHDITYTNDLAPGSGDITGVAFSPNAIVVPGPPIFAVNPGQSKTNQIQLPTLGTLDIMVFYSTMGILTEIEVYKNATLVSTQIAPAPGGTVTFSGILLSASDTIEIKLV